MEHHMSQLNIVITGAADAIGHAVAVALARPGTTFVLAAQDGVALEALSADILAAGGSTYIACCDVTREADVRRLIATACRDNPIDLVVNVVSTTAVAAPRTTQWAAWEHEHQAEIASAALVCTHAAPHVRPGGVIVNVAPAFMQQPGALEATAQAAQHAFLEWNARLRHELRSSDIRVSLVMPAQAEGDDLDAAPSDDTPSQRATRVAQAAIQLARRQPLLAEESLLQTAEQIALPIQDGLGQMLGPHPSQERILLVAEVLQAYANALLRLAPGAGSPTRDRSAARG